MIGPTAVGLVLAAGEGRRLGGPKALVVGPTGQTWLGGAVEALRAGGLDDVYVVVGAAADAVRAASPDGCELVEAKAWREGMGASLRAGLAAVAQYGDRRAGRAADAVVIMLVDTPGVGSAVVARLLVLATPSVLARATYAAVPGHPVLIGRDHLAGVAVAARGDRGARDYLSGHQVAFVECGDIGSGADVDTPALLASWRSRTGPGHAAR